MNEFVCTNQSCKRHGVTFITFADTRCSWCGENAATLDSWKEGTCMHGRVRDWSTASINFNEPPIRHWYCPDCQRRWFREKEYSKAEWEVFVNSED